jgi:hypothetical protein
MIGIESVVCAFIIVIRYAMPLLYFCQAELAGIKIACRLIITHRYIDFWSPK